MSTAKVNPHQHRKKKYVFRDRESPFPVPLASITREAPSKNFWYQYTGQLQGDVVLVTHSGDISYLNRMGFFGKGLMSRGDPAVYKQLPRVHLPSANNTEPDLVPVMRRRMYLKHMKWRKSHDQRLANESKRSGSSADEEFDSDVDYSQEGFAQNGHLPPDHIDQGISNDTDKDSVIPKIDGDSSEQPTDNSVLNVNQNASSWSWDNEVANRNQALESWEMPVSNQKSATESWDTAEPDEDFWASETVKSDTNLPREKTLSDLDEKRLNDMENSTENSAEEKQESVDTDTSFHSPFKRIKLCNDSDELYDENKKDGLAHDSSDSLNIPEKKAENDSNECKSSEKLSKSDEEQGHLVDRTEEKMEISPVQEGEKSSSTLNHFDKTDNGEDTGNAVKENVGSDGKNVQNSLPLNPYCLTDTDDNDGVVRDIDEKTANTNEEIEYLVIDDSDIDDSTVPVHKKEKYKWLPVRKKEVFYINEPLVLSLEEAFFLSYGLGCLTVVDEDHSSLTLSEMWCRFCTKGQFLPRYVTYHYFRSKGWVIKPNILYGTDFLVYKVGPVFYHASYSVIVKTVYSDTYEEVEGQNRKFTWTSFFGLNRVTEHVAKTLVYCYVIVPRDLSEEERRSPDCISRFKVRLQTVQRWVSSQEREKTKTTADIS